MKLKIQDLKVVEEYDWSNFVSEVYGRPYNFQQQECCRERGVFHFSVPCDYSYNEEQMHDEIPEVINGNIMGVKFDKWLEKDPNEPEFDQDYKRNLFWERNFYPNIYTVVNDLYSKGLLEEGAYLINIDW